MPIVVPRDEVEPEEYLVYEVVLAQRFAPHCSEMVVSGMSFGMRNQAGAMCPRPGRPLFLHPVAVVRVPAPRRTIALDGTVFGTPMDTVAGMGLAGLRQDTLDNYRRRPPAAVAARFRTPVELPIARSDREYPRFFFTRVGFSDDGAQALMYEAFEEPARYDQGCSDGVYYLLSKRDGSWVIDQARRVDGGCS